jgi:hypothetical protein
MPLNGWRRRADLAAKLHTGQRAESREISQFDMKKERQQNAPFHETHDVLWQNIRSVFTAPSRRAMPRQEIIAF